MLTIRCAVRSAVATGLLATLPALSHAGEAGAPVNATCDSLRLAIVDLTGSFGPRYPRGGEFLRRLEALEPAVRAGKAGALQRLERLRAEALLSNPLLDFESLLVVRRAARKPNNYTALGLPRNHQCNSSLPRRGYDNEIALLSPVSPRGDLRTLHRPRGSFYIGEVDLHFDADRLLFTLPDGKSWKIHEIGIDGSGRRPIPREGHDDVDHFDPCYLPDGRILFGSTANYQSVPCWHGLNHRVASLYVMEADGSGVRQLCYDQDHDLYPAVLNDGRVIYSRWDYTGVRHEYLRQLMVMNPDGTLQRAVYGTNSWWPNALYYPRPIPGHPSKIIAIVSGYHGAPRQGELVLLDIARGDRGADGVLQRIPGRGERVKPIIREKLILESWPKFMHPYPLSDRYFLVACRPTARHNWGIYLADVFDNLVPVRTEPGFALLEPIPVRRTPRPPVRPDTVDLERQDAVVYLHDVYAGPGLDGVPRGTIKKLRILAYHFAYPGIGGPNKIGMGGPWEVVRILGTVGVHEDGSAMFRVPANTPLSVQPLDADGKAVQLMRSWYTAMPGEAVSCVGCHERHTGAPVVRHGAAANRPPADIEPWYGPPRGFDFEREVQPVLDRHCVGCHDGRPRADGQEIIDLRAERHVPDYRGQWLHPLGERRLPPGIRESWGGRAPYTPAYDALLPFVRRAGLEDGVDLLVPAEYHADTSPLIQMLERGHHNVRLDREAWDRLITWIDLNAPCHGTWGEVYPIPGDAHRRRMELRRLFGGPGEDPEAIPAISLRSREPLLPESRPRTAVAVSASRWPCDAPEARRRQEARGPVEMEVDLGEGVTLRLRRIPAGEFVMGDAEGPFDEGPPVRVSIERDFWIGVTEVTNRQYRRFDSSHDSGYCPKYGQTADLPGLSLNGADQPVVRVSWRRAMAFCQWLSERTGKSFTLPSEAQWEYACRAGTDTPLFHGGLDADFSVHANLADRSMLGDSPFGDRSLEWTAVGWSIGKPCDTRWDDGAVVTTSVGSYRPNAWGLTDMHGNAAEWTRSIDRPVHRHRLPGAGESRGSPAAPGRRVVRGGSWCERPSWSRSASRLSYPDWQRVHNVGFRVICETEPST